MSELQQLVYISRAAFAPSQHGMGVEPEVGRILVQSRLNNPRRGLVGALYYGDGCFFQCLEGPSPALDALYNTLLADPRHRDLKVLHRRTIRDASFNEWAMKYVPGAREVKALMKKHGLKRFDPYTFGPGVIRDMVDLLHRGSDHEGDAAPVRPGVTSGRQGGLVAGLIAASLIAAAVVAWLVLH